jgi:uncharacterized damage-inducible protein DinB
MRETERIADQLKRAIYGEAWSGPSVLEVLNGVTPETAAAPAVPGAHSIWELVRHINAWMEIVRRRVEGEAVHVTEDINFPPPGDTSEAAWRQTLNELERAAEALRKTILDTSETRLEEPGLPGGDTVSVLLHGAIQHALYHAGQIALLRKAAA